MGERGDQAPTWLLRPGAPLDHRGKQLHRSAPTPDNRPQATYPVSGNGPAMSKRCKEHNQPEKMQGFFLSIPKDPRQNGVSSHAMQQAPKASTQAADHGPHAQGNQTRTPHSGTPSGNSSPSTQSPVKSKPRRDSPPKHHEDPDMEISRPQTHRDSTGTLRGPHCSLPHHGPACIRHHAERHDDVTQGFTGI